MKEKYCVVKYTVVIIPLVFLWAGLNFDRNNYPNDPEYIYLMNALCICDLQSVGHIDNPGTTLIQLSAATIGVKHLFFQTENDRAIENVLKQPGVFIESIRKVMVVLNSVFLFLLGWIVFKKTNSVWRALFMQLCMLVSSYILGITWASLSPEPLLFLLTGLYVILIFWYYHDEDKYGWKYVILFALITGAGLGTKATFLPLTIFPLIVLPTGKKKVLYLLGVVPSFILFTIPAIPEYDAMFYWFRNMINHSGIYGHGEKQFIDFKTYFPNIKKIVVSNSLILVAMSVTTFTVITILLIKKTKLFQWELKFLAGLLGVFVFGILLVAKHYGGNHYLIPVLLLSGISLYINIDLILRLAKTNGLKLFLLPIIVVSLVFFIGWNHPGKMIISNRQYKAASEEIDSTNLWVEKNFGNYTQINYYIYSINKFTGLKFGNDFAKGKMLPYLKEMYPRTYFFELSSNTYLNWNLKTSLQEIIETNGNKILLMNAPTDTSKIIEMEKLGFPLKMVYGGNSQNIYILDTLKYTRPEKDSFKQVGLTINFNADEFTSDKKYFVGSNLEVFGPVNAISTDDARSGKYSIKLEKSNPFAIDYNLENTNTGERYQVDVWRKSNSSNGSIVIAADDTQIYYRSQNEAIKFDDNGWELLRINLYINPEIEGKKLKIYLYNPRKEVAYFDDLSIKVFEVDSVLRQFNL